MKIQWSETCKAIKGQSSGQPQQKKASLIEKEIDEFSYRAIKKFQKTNHKYQTNHNDLNSKSQIIGGRP